MCKRSDAWYAIPANRERRQKNMRAYMSALVALGRSYPDEYRKAYQQARPGRARSAAQQLGYAVVRDRHSEEFRQVLAELREA